MRRFLLEKGWIPSEKKREATWFEKCNPWILRKEGLERELTKHEFGRVLLHMSQRRGAYGFDIDEENEDAGKIKDAINQTRKAMEECQAHTFGDLVAKKFEERRLFG
jgi:CRISPR-associated endonuclease Csn1